MKKLVEATDLFKLNSLSQLQVAGEDVFFLETRICKKDNAYKSTLYSFNTKTNAKKAWLSDMPTINQLKLSPDKKYLSFTAVSDKEVGSQVYLMSTEGGQAFQLTKEDRAVTNYLWSNDSRTVYYQTTKSTAPEVPEEEKTWAKTKEYEKLSYKGDGVGYYDEAKVYQFKKVAVEATFEDIEAELILEDENSFNVQYVSKAGDWFLYQGRLDNDNEWFYGSSVYKYNLSDKSTKLLTTAVKDGVFRYGDMSCDEKYLLLVGNDFKYRYVTQDKLYLYDLSTEELTCLTKDFDLEVNDVISGDFQQKSAGFPVSWVNDREFVFPVSYQGSLRVYRGDVAGNISSVNEKKAHITEGAKYNDDTYAVVYSTPTIPNKLALLDLKTGKLSDLYDPNEAYSNEHKFVEPSEFWFKASDDWNVHGWYYEPAVKDETKEKHPAILYIHGGPQVAYGETFFHEMQYLASLGYGVIMMNPRGSNSYGQEHVAWILGDYGNRDYKDLMEGLDYALDKHPEIDQDALYVVGGSYGGFMTNWVVTHTDRFKAACTQRCISNWISFYGVSDIGPHFTYFQLQNDLDNVERLWEMSPLAHANNAKTPLLILHSEEDYRCPQDQGEQFYIAMKKNGVDTKLVLYPDSSHGLSRNGLPHFRIHRLNEISAWFEKYK